MNKRVIGLVVPALLLLLLAGRDAASAADPVSLAVNPDRIEVGTFYHGTTVRVTADAPRCDASILTLESEGTKLDLNRKGRLGPVWMNVARVTVRGAPAVYLLASSENLAAICSPQVREQLGLGFEALRGKVSFASDGPLTGQEFDEFLKLKMRHGTYSEHISMQMRPTNESRQTITASLQLPSVMPPGDYRLRLYCFEDGMEIAGGASELTIEKVGLPRLEGELAHRHPAAYGVLAVLAAAAAGVGTGILFTSRGRGGH